MGDVTNPKFMEKLKNIGFKSVICSNLLEHVPEKSRKEICDSLSELIPEKGYFFISGPYKFPYHPDPIDTMYRPNIEEMASLFPNTTIIESSIITSNDHRKPIELAKNRKERIKTRLYNMDITIDYKSIYKNLLSISQTYYNMKLRDEINGFASDGNGGYTALNMSNNSYRKGLETQIKVFLNDSSKITFKHDYVDSTQYDTTTKKQTSEVRRPKNIYNIIYENTLSKYLHLNTNIFYSSKIKDTDFSSWPYKTVFLNDYIIANAKINYIVDANNKISFMVNNIFNRKYSEVYGYNNSGFEFQINYFKSF